MINLNFLNSATAGYIEVVFFSLLLFGVLWWHFSYWNLFKTLSAKRLIPHLIMLSAVIGIPLIQIHICRSIISFSTEPTSQIFAIFVATQETIALIIMIYCANRYGAPGTR
jgi:hypothetical protein